MGLTHFDDARTFDYELGHLRGRWTMLGESAGSRTVGVRRIQLARRMLVDPGPRARALGGDLLRPGRAGHLLAGRAHGRDPGR